jgi:outer membrane protein assembly factor BamB
MMTLAVVSRAELPAAAAAVESKETVMNPMDSSGGGGGGAKTLWKPVVDPSSGKTYYVNRETKETVWKRPADADTPWIKGGAAGGSGGGAGGDALPDGWVEHFDQKKQKPYYHNTATGETAWRRPTPCVACDECIAPPTLPCQRRVMPTPTNTIASHLLCSANSDSGEDSIEV